MLKEKIRLEEKIREIAEEILKRHVGNETPQVEKFLAEVFRWVAKEYDLCRNYQARAQKFGEAFEISFKVFMEFFFPEIKLVSSFPLKDACMGRLAEADFVVLHNDKIVTVIEAKGSDDHIVCNDDIIKIRRPGMIRTDTVKKALTNAYLVKKTYPGVLFFIVTNHTPNSGSARCMIQKAKGDIVDMIVNITNFSEVNRMVEMIRERLGR